MYCTSTDWCDCVVKTEEDIHIERIFRDQKWWDGELQLLRTFYDSFLPELASSRHWKGGIREPTKSLLNCVGINFFILNDGKNFLNFFPCLSFCFVDIPWAAAPLTYPIFKFYLPTF